MSTTNGALREPWPPSRASKAKRGTTAKGRTPRGKSRTARKAIDGMPSKAKANREWFLTRMAALGLTQKTVGDAVGFRKEGISRVLAGTRDVSAAEAVALAGVLKCSVTELLRHLDLPAGHGMALSGRVLPDGTVSHVIDTAIEPAVVGEYPVDAVALLIEAQQGPLASYDGAVLVYRPSTARHVGPDAVGRLCVLEDAASPLPVVGELLPATGARENRIRVFGTGAEITAKRLVRASRVLAIHLPQG